VRPVLITVHGVRIWSYPALLYAGLVAGFYAMYLVAPGLGLRAGSAALAFLILFVPALVGARLWFVLDHWPEFRSSPRRVWRRAEGGLTLYGGLVLALLASPLLLSVMGIAFAAFWDCAAFAICVAMVFVRVGCLLNGCCAGRPCDASIGVVLPGADGGWQRRYPVPILEGASALLLLSVAAALQFLSAPRGTIFLCALTGYTLVRVGLDPLRERCAAQRLSHSSALTLFTSGAIVLFTIGWLIAGG
jgi:prolipoprotein diacylglyceryltransferase